jgi:hypothetical protein
MPLQLLCVVVTVRVTRRRMMRVTSTHSCSSSYWKQVRKAAVGVAGTNGSVFGLYVRDWVPPTACCTLPAALSE